MNWFSKHIIVITAIIFVSKIGYSQDLIDFKINSLENAIGSTYDDTIKINILKSLSEKAFPSNPKKDYLLQKEIEKICIKNLAKDINKKEILKFKTELSITYDRIGNYLDFIGISNRSLMFYNKSLELSKQIDNKLRIAKSFINIGNIYFRSNNYKYAIDYYKKSQKINKILNNQSGISKAQNMTGAILLKMGDYKNSLKFLNQSLENKFLSGDSSSVSTVYSNIGFFYDKQKKYDSALYFYKKALQYDRKYNNIEGEIISLMNIGEIHRLTGLKKLSHKINNKALKIAQENKTHRNIKNISNSLYKIYSESNNYSKALKMHEIYSNSSDSINKYNANIQIQKIEYEKNIKIQDTKLVLQKEEILREKTKNNALLIIVTIVVIFLLILNQNFLKTKKQKLIIDKQHNELHETHKEIQESIDYAKKIQDALLVSKDYIKKIFPDSFIYYQPKDIVSGDFYWAHKVNNNKLFFTVADCTGHGVPGAMVSMIGNALLNENIVSKKIYDTAIILANMRDKVSELFNEEGLTDENKDGMHMALCCINKKEMILEYSGAFNPLILIRNGELKEIKADPQPVAMYTGKSKPFTKHSIKLKSDDSIYLYSDGFQDQFGGQRNKKYMSKKFKQFLVKINTEASDKQKKLIKLEFDNWKKGYDQIDDVCIMGIKVH